jgi:hypothetical protein
MFSGSAFAVLGFFTYFTSLTAVLRKSEFTLTQRPVQRFIDRLAQFQYGRKRAVNRRIFDALKLGCSRDRMRGALDEAAQRRVGYDDMPGLESGNAK